MATIRSPDLSWEDHSASYRGFLQGDAKTTRQPASLEKAALGARGNRMKDKFDIWDAVSYAWTEIGLENREYREYAKK